MLIIMYGWNKTRVYCGPRVYSFYDAPYIASDRCQRGLPRRRKYVWNMIIEKFFNILRFEHWWFSPAREVLLGHNSGRFAESVSLVTMLAAQSPFEGWQYYVSRSECPEHRYNVYVLFAQLGKSIGWPFDDANDLHLTFVSCRKPAYFFLRSLSTSVSGFWLVVMPCFEYKIDFGCISQMPLPCRFWREWIQFVAYADFYCACRYFRLQDFN